MSFIDGEEKLLGLQIKNPFEVYKPNVHTEAQKSIYGMFCNAYVTPFLDPTHCIFGVDLAKEDSLSDLHINVKRRKIKFNFNN